MRSLAIAFVAAAGLSTAAVADIAPPVFGAGGPISDGAPLVSEVFVDDNLGIIDIRIALVGLQHTAVGDLTVTLEHVDTGDSITLFTNTGGAPPNGDNTNLGPSGPNTVYDFDDVYTADWWSFADFLDDDQFIPGGNYFASDDTGALLSMDDTFGAVPGGGTLAGGTWRLTITDNSPSDNGSLEFWSLKLEVIPAPSAIALLGIAGLLGRRRRR